MVVAFLTSAPYLTFSEPYGDEVSRSGFVIQYIGNRRGFFFFVFFVVFLLIFLPCKHSKTCYSVELAIFYILSNFHISFLSCCLLLFFFVRYLALFAMYSLFSLLLFAASIKFSALSTIGGSDTISDYGASFSIKNHCN